MKPSELRSLRLCVSFAALAPVLAVAAFKLAGARHGPAAAAAAETPTAAAKAIDLRPPSRQDSLLAAIDASCAKPLGAVPFAEQVRRIEAPQAKTTPDSKPIAPRQDPLPTFRLSSVMAGARETVAVIDGKIRHVSDDLGDGWTVRSIDHAAGVVVLAGPKDRGITLRLRD